MEVDMRYPARTALVLQGGGAALQGGRFLTGHRRRCLDQIGAITAVLLARPAKGMKPVEALEAFWQRVTVTAPFLPPHLRPYASAFGNPSFFMPRLDYYALPSWTNIYDTEPLRQTLSQLVDPDAL